MGWAPAPGIASFHILNQSTVTIHHVEIYNGQVDYGGGVRVEAGSTLTLDDVMVRANASNVDGGGVINYGALTLNNSTVYNNTAVGNGGGVTITAR